METESKTNIVSRGFYGVSFIFSSIGRGVQLIADVYYITVSACMKLPPQENVSVVPESHTMYLQIAEDGTPNFVRESNQATPVKFLRGASIVKALNQQFKTTNSEDKEYISSAALIPMGDVFFMQKIREES